MKNTYKHTNTHFHHTNTQPFFAYKEQRLIFALDEDNSTKYEENDELGKIFDAFEQGKTPDQEEKPIDTDKKLDEIINIADEPLNIDALLQQAHILGEGTEKIVFDATIKQENIVIDGNEQPCFVIELNGKTPGKTYKIALPEAASHKIELPDGNSLQYTLNKLPQSDLEKIKSGKGLDIAFQLMKPKEYVLSTTRFASNIEGVQQQTISDITRKLSKSIKLESDITNTIKEQAQKIESDFENYDRHSTIETWKKALGRISQIEDKAIRLHLIEGVIIPSLPTQLRSPLGDKLIDIFGKQKKENKDTNRYETAKINTDGLQATAAGIVDQDEDTFSQPNINTDGLQATAAGIVDQDEDTFSQPNINTDGLQATAAGIVDQDEDDFPQPNINTDGLNATMDTSSSDTEKIKRTVDERQKELLKRKHDKLFIGNGEIPVIYTDPQNKTKKHETWHITFERKAHQFELYGEPIETIQKIIEAAKGLAELHQKGLIHRDVKPDNLLEFTGSDGKDHIVFGDTTSSAPMEFINQIEPKNTIFGSPAYKMPDEIEQRSSPRSDTRSMAMMLFEAITGKQLLWNRPPSFDEIAPDKPYTTRAALKAAMLKEAIIIENNISGQHLVHRDLDNHPYIPPQIKDIIAKYTTEKQGITAQNFANDLQEALSDFETIEALKNLQNAQLEHAADIIQTSENSIEDVNKKIEDFGPEAMKAFSQTTNNLQDMLSEYKKFQKENVSNNDFETFIEQFFEKGIAEERTQSYDSAEDALSFMDDDFGISSQEKPVNTKKIVIEDVVVPETEGIEEKYSEPESKETYGNMSRADLLTQIQAVMLDENATEKIRKLWQDKWAPKFNQELSEEVKWLENQLIENLGAESIPDIFDMFTIQFAVAQSIDQLDVNWNKIKQRLSEFQTQLKDIYENSNWNQIFESFKIAIEQKYRLKRRELKKRNGGSTRSPQFNTV